MTADTMWQAGGHACSNTNEDKHMESSHTGNGAAGHHRLRGGKAGNGMYMFKNLQQRSNDAHAVL